MTEKPKTEGAPAEAEAMPESEPAPRQGDGRRSGRAPGSSGGRARRRPHGRTNGELVAGLVLVVVGLIANPWLIFLGFGLEGDAPLIQGGVILLVDLGLVALGVQLIRGKLRMAHLILLTLATLIGILFFEAALRGFFYTAGAFKPRARFISDKYGWESAANIVEDYTRDFYGDVRYTSADYGFREFGDLATSGTKLLVLGDSYTMAREVSNPFTYYRLLAEKNPGLEIFVYGSGGFGSLQEYLVLDDYFDLIEPDLILWQMCSNDLVNNDHTLESLSHFNNNLMTRPYLEDGEVVFKYPQQSFGFFHAIARNSYLLRMMNMRYNLSKKMEDTIEFNLPKGDPRLEKTIATTREIFRMASERAGATPIAAFLVDDHDWYHDAFERIMADQEGIVFLRSISPAIEEMRAAGEVVDNSPADAHWTIRGHEIAAEAIDRELKELGLIPRPDDTSINITNNQNH